MARLTRKSFKRKRILLGICMFISIAMISTGFAAWVISTDANKEVTGNVNVGTITEAQMEFIDVKLSNDSFNFEALESDNTGRVTADFKDDAVYENLVIVVSGKISNADYLSKVTIDFTIPAKVIEAANQGYITLPNNVTDDNNDGVYSAEVSTSTVDADGFVTFEFTLQFGWGAIFGEMNPGLYYDTEGKGKEIAEDVMMQTLGQFYMLVYEATDYSTATANGTAPTFKIVLKATAN